MRLAHRSHGASLRAIRTATPARCPVGRPSSRLRARHREVPRQEIVEPAPFYAPTRGNPSWRQRHSTPRSDHCTRREAWSSERDHGERHFGARNPLLRGSADLRQLLARRPLLHAGLHLRDRERRGREVSAVFANESFTGIAGGDRWLSRHYPKGHPARARWRTTQLARGKSLESPGTQAVGRRANAFTKTRRRRRSHRAHQRSAKPERGRRGVQGSGRSQRGCTVERSCSRIRVHARRTRSRGLGRPGKADRFPPNLLFD